jgi:methionyl-tRNA synthetase
MSVPASPVQPVLVTGALPYANGPIHLGHLVEYVQADIYVRFLKSCGVDAIYLCADDTHGTPIELNAAKQGLTPEAFIARWYESHQADFRDFQVAFDQYGSTNSPENKHYASLVYERLKAAGDIERRDIEQTWCEKDARFLPDRFVRGTCPHCKAPDQFGDVCDKCGRTHEPTALLDPRCSLCGTPPSRKRSTHLFFKLSRHAEELNRFIRDPAFVHPGVSAQLQQFFEKGLADWDISRDGPYFGFPIPGETDKFFYVWLDAPIGYIAATEQWAKATGRAKDALAHWGQDASTRILHFIGKDIVYFHALFWPTVLKVAGLRRPDRLVVHGHLTVNGEKMSKSKGTFISARQYLDALDPSYLRFFYASNLGPGVEDLDLSLTEFRLRVNADLVNNIGNLANRSLTLLAGPMDGTLHPGGDGAGRTLVEEALAKARTVREAFEQLDYRAALKGICEISQAANGFLQAAAPWAKQKTDKEAARADLSDVADVAYLVAGLLQPVVPVLSAKLFAQLGAVPLTYAQISTARYPLLDRSRPVGKPEPLIGRLEETQVNALVPTTSAPPAPEKEKKPEEKKAAPPPAKAEAAAPAEIEYADFAKVVLKVGKVLAAEPVPKADKLLKLTVDVGEGSPRTIGAGIALSYKPEQLVGRNVVVVANLKPRAIRGIESRGMLLAAGADEKALSLVDPGPLPPGTEVR